MRINEINAPVQPDTYEASMFISQSIRAGKYAIKIHNLLHNDQEMESWVAKKVDLASGYIASIGHYMEGTTESVAEDAGEGHMSKSQLYATAKYALQIASVVRPGDDIEGWVQTKMNRAVDMLDAVYHYEDYQRLNPYREELGDLHQRHAGIVQKNIDQILATETAMDDIETIPGMLNIMKRRVQEVEKKMARKSVKEDTMDDRLKTRLQQIAINNGAIATDYMGGSLFVKFAGQTAKLKADKTHVLIRQNVKHHYPDTGVNMFRVGDEFVYDFVPLASEKPDADHTNEGSRMPASMIRTKQKLDSMSPEEINHFFQKRAHQHGKPARELARSQELRYGKEVAAKAPYSRHVSEAPTGGDQELANELSRYFAKSAKEMLQNMQRPNKNDVEYQEYVDIAQEFKQGIQAGLDQVNKSDFEFSNNPFGDFGRGIDDGPDEELVKILAKYGYRPGPDGDNDEATIVKQQKESSVSEEILDEDFKGWLQKMAAAGIIVGGLAGIGTVMNAIDNSVPAIQAINKALDSAEQRGDTKLASMIQKDLQDAKLRLDTGKDLNQVKYLQDKYKNFMPAGYKSEDKDDQEYPPHLQDLFKKLRDKQAQNKEIDAKVTDATPAGYGPKDDAVNEYSPFKNKVLSKIAKPASDYAEKLKTLNMLARDPNTNRDPELQRELIRRKQQLITTKESSTVLYTNRLTDMMGKRLGESWANKFKTS
jgi:hypothetical protein